MTETIDAWHFVPENRKMRHGDGTEIAAGYIYTFDGEPKLCEQGLHASINAMDALSYSPGPIICRVRLGGEIITGDDKCVATEREVLWMADATETLGAFARWAALEVAHLWNMPQVVRRYLETGNESLRNAACEAAMTAAMTGARAGSMAVRDAAWSAAKVAACDIAWDAAWSAAKVAAMANQEKKLTEMLMELRDD